MPSVEVELPIMGHSMLTHPHCYGHGAVHFTQTYNPDGVSPLSPSSVYSQPPSRPKHSHGSLSFLSSGMSRSESSEQLPAPSRRTLEKFPVTVSPFRSVRQMKEPFQLKLPHSPSFENNLVVSSSFSTRELKENKSQPRSLRSPIGLPPLRTCRSDQNLVAGALETFGLLPSPTLSEPRLTSKLNTARRDFLVQKEKPLPVPKCLCYLPTQKCEFCLAKVEREVISPVDTITATFCQAEIPEEVPTQTLAPSFSSQEMRNPTSTPQLQQLNEIKSPPISSTKNHKRSRTTTVSSAASWVPENLTYCEDWLQKVPLETPEREDGRGREVNRRKFQIVQQTDDPFPISRPTHQTRKPAGLSIDTDVANNPVMLAVASKTKPKLVDISRSSSSGTTFSIPMHPPPSWRRPSTPEQRSINEISAFSPDTPQDIPDSGYVTQQSNRSSDESHEFRDDEYDAAFEIAAIESSSEPPCNLSFMTSIFTDQKPKHRYYMSSYNRHKPSSSHKKDEPPRTPPAMSPKTVDQETLVKFWDYEWTLDQLEDSIKAYSKYALRLTSPVIILIRQNHENTIIRPFKKIFPTAQDNLIDSLCAALIARNYLVSMASTHHHRLNNTSPSHTISQFNTTSSNLSKLDSVPEKARATLGLAFPTNPCKLNLNIPNQTMGARSLEIQKGLDRIVDKLLFSICGRHDETLKASVTVLMQVLELKESKA
uniref:Unconventional myosin heavy chain 6 n=1 Tax=Talaromyces marneffei PM1 TaxID=1077442 RepID=A0A093VBJ9_TALMA